MADARRRVLLVEDDPQIREFLTDALGDEGFNVQVATDGRSALETLRTFDPHLILLDLRMPDMDGWSFRERQLADDLAPHVPLLVLTAVHALPERMERLGAAAVIPKPFDLEELLSAAQQYCLRD
jgi:two-component system, OmpR family, response regulator